MNSANVLHGSLELEVEHAVGSLRLKLSFALSHPVTALFAPSGAGKSTVLRLIAGLDRPGSGRITLAGETLTETAGGVFVPPHRRRIRMVAQRPALFPHLSVSENLGFGTRAEVPEALIDLCRVRTLLEKRPAQLSGGERQRVALARALAADQTRLMLLDEPFTGLENTLKDQLLRELMDWTVARDLPVLLVTHDVAEVFAARAHVLRMHEGEIVAAGPAVEVLAEDRLRLLERLSS